MRYMRRMTKGVSSLPHCDLLRVTNPIARVLENNERLRLIKIIIENDDR